MINKIGETVKAVPVATEFKDNTELVMSMLQLLMEDLSMLCNKLGRGAERLDKEDRALVRMAASRNIAGLIEELKVMYLVGNRHQVDIAMEELTKLLRLEND